jgi:hypothetical protein
MSKRTQVSQTSKIIQHRYNNPHDTLQQIGDAFGVSRQYIYKVLKQNNVPTIRAKKMKNVRHCKICEEISTKLVHDGSCHFQYYNIKINCSYCRVPFYRKRSQIIKKYNSGYNNIYCSNGCYYRGKRVAH